MGCPEDELMLSQDQCESTQELHEGWRMRSTFVLDLYECELLECMDFPFIPQMNGSYDDGVLLVKRGSRRRVERYKR